MLLSASPFESHQDLLSRGFAFHSFVDEMSLPLDPQGKQLAPQDTAQAISTPPPPPPPAPVVKEAPSGSNKRKRSAPAAEARPSSRMPATLPNSASSGAANTLAEPASPESDKKRNKLGYHRTSVACSHCRRRKIRCMVPDDDSTGRCANCVRLKKDCTFCPVDDTTQARRPQTSSGVSAPGILPSPEPLIKTGISHSISPSMSTGQAREMMPVTADSGLGIFGAVPQAGDHSRVRDSLFPGAKPATVADDPYQWYSQMAGWSDKSQSSIFAATPLSAKSAHAPSTSYGMPSPYSMPSASTSLYGRPASSMTPLSEDARSTTSFQGDFGWAQPVQPAGRSMSFMENYATHPGYAGAQSMMQPRRAMTLPSSTMVYPDPTMTTLSMGVASTMAPTTGAQNVQWNPAVWDQTQQTKDIYGQDAFAFDAQGQWYQGGSSAPPF